MKRLLLGPAPDDFSPDSHVPLGPFCFLGREDRFPGFEDLDYLPEPLQDPDKLERESKIAVAFADRMLPLLVDHLNRCNNANHSPEFWRLLLMPWLVPFAQVLRERQIAIRQVVAVLGSEPILVEPAQDVDGWHFSDIDDWFARGVMSLPFNAWLYSRILENSAPAAWTIRPVSDPDVARAAGECPPVDFGVRPLGLHNAWPKFRKLFYAFSRCRGNIYGFTPWDRLLFSLVLAMKKPVQSGKPAHVEPLGEPVAEDWDFDAQAIVMQCIPRCFEELRTIPAQTPRTRSGKLRLAGNVLFSVEPEKLFLARCVEAGERIVSVQHGGLNAIMQENRYEEEIIFKPYTLFSWGWKHYGGYAVDAVPLPSPLLSRHADGHRETGDRLIVVGEYAPLFANRLKSMPTPLQNLVYRRNLDAFFGNVPEELRSRVDYRPYLNETAALQNRAWLGNRFPWLGELAGDGEEFHARMLNCRLFVHSYPGTTFNLAMAANVPSLCFWHADAWRMAPEAHELMEAFRGAGVLFEGGGDCAEAAADLFDHVQEWWNGSEIQEIRLNYCDRFARASRHWRREWIAALRGL